MDKFRTILIVIGSLLILAAIVILLLNYIKPEACGLTVESTPASKVFLDGTEAGQTPHQTTRKAGDIVLKLVPADTALLPYETKVSLVSGVRTIVRRNFGDSLETSSGETIWFEKNGGKIADFTMVTDPDAASLTIDGKLMAFTPYKTSTLAVGEHKVVVSANGYKDRNLTLRTVLGYKLTLVVKLAATGESETATVQKPPEEPKVSMVEILKTPTGYLRVRIEPNLTSKEVAQVKSGEKLALVSQDEKTGWFEIEYKKGLAGWVTNQYAKVVEVSLISGSTPSPTVKIPATSTPSATPEI